MNFDRDWLPIAGAVSGVGALVLAIVALVAAGRADARAERASTEAKQFAAAAALVTGEHTGQLKELERQLDLAQMLIRNQNASRSFVLARSDRAQPPLAECILRLPGSALERMTAAERSELLDLQRSIWHDALTEVYGQVPPGSILVITVGSSLGKETQQTFGRFIGSRWVAEKK